jgi:hypothetical protein
MDSFIRPARRAGMAAVATASLVSGVFFAWHAIDPAVLASTSTLRLGVIIGLFLLPLLAAAAWQADRNTADYRRLSSDRSDE